MHTIHVFLMTNNSKRCILEGRFIFSKRTKKRLYSTENTCYLIIAIILYHLMMSLKCSAPLGKFRGF